MKWHVCWKNEDAPALHQMLKSIKVVDVIYIKSFVVKKQELSVKALGIVTSTAVDNVKNLQYCAGVEVKWLKNFEPFSVQISDDLYRKICLTIHCMRNIT